MAEGFTQQCVLLGHNLVFPEEVLQQQQQNRPPKKEQSLSPLISLKGTLVEVLITSSYNTFIIWSKTAPRDDGHAVIIVSMNCNEY